MDKPVTDVLIRNAKRIRNFEPAVVPRLLQTAGYARYCALEAARQHGAAGKDPEASLVAQMQEQEILYNAGMTFEFVITGSALNYPPPSPSVMLGQLYRLMSATQFANITLGIMPPGTKLAIAPIPGFLLADNITVVEMFPSRIIVQGEESALCARKFDGFIAEAIKGEDARDLISSTAAVLRAKERRDFSYSIVEQGWEHGEAGPPGCGFPIR